MIRRMISWMALPALALTACTGDGRQVSGQLDLAALGRSQVELVALRSDGTFQKAAVASDGHFRVKLDAGWSYALAFKDTSAPNGPHFAVLSYKGSGKQLTSTVKISAGAPVDLGRVTLPSLQKSLQDYDGRSDDEKGGDDDGGRQCTPPAPGPSRSGGQGTCAGGQGGTDAGAPGGVDAGMSTPPEGTNGAPMPPAGPPPRAGTGAGTGTGGGTGAGSGGITFGLKVVGQRDLALECATVDGPHPSDALKDSNGNGCPDKIDEDPNHTGMCASHHDDDDDNSTPGAGADAGRAAGAGSASSADGGAAVDAGCACSNYYGCGGGEGGDHEGGEDGDHSGGSGSGGGGGGGGHGRH